MDRSENRDKLHHQLHRLTARHRKLKARIGQERKRPKPDELILQKLKRLKLRTKDGIAHVMYALNGPKAKVIPQTI